ncbi:hypothetical protein MVI01_60160 [Myxococcus virescens]|uniref:Uncharacterized protein n=1 Tax=Myxococcus virescens TaxID=83456 RepID=A0A511HKX9_9BACT|nr:hypothetical protein MVI01_60160 [Myxococcus virescens]
MGGAGRGPPAVTPGPGWKKRSVHARLFPTRHFPAPRVEQGCHPQVVPGGYIGGMVPRQVDGSGVISGVTVSQRGKFTQGSPSCRASGHWDVLLRPRVTLPGVGPKQGGALHMCVRSLVVADLPATPLGGQA